MQEPASEGRFVVRMAGTSACCFGWQGLSGNPIAVPALRLVVGKLCSFNGSRTPLAAAVKEYGALRRSIYPARYLAGETYRRRIVR